MLKKGFKKYIYVFIFININIYLMYHKHNYFFSRSKYIFLDFFVK